MSPQPQAAVGAPLSRVDGRLKVTGKAKYAADTSLDGVVHAVIVDSEHRPRPDHRHRHPRRRSPARRAEGDQPPQRAQAAVPRQRRVEQPAGRAAARLPGRPGPLPRPAGRRRGGHHPGGRPARARAWSKVAYDAEQPSTDLHRAPTPDEPTTYARGDADAALRSAPVRLDLTYRTGPQPPQPDGAARHHRPLGRRPADRVGQDPVGGGHRRPSSPPCSASRRTPCASSRRSSAARFGSGLRCWPHVVIAALAARESETPGQARPDAAGRCTSAPASGPPTSTGCAWAATGSGRLTATTHEMRAETSSLRDVHRGRPARPGRCSTARPTSARRTGRCRWT